MARYALLLKYHLSFGRITRSLRECARGDGGNYTCYACEYRTHRPYPLNIKMRLNTMKGLCLFGRQRRGGTGSSCFWDKRVLQRGRIEDA